MKNALSMILSVALIGAAMPTVALAQEAADQSTAEEASGEQMTPEQRARKVEELAAAGANAYRAGDFEAAISSFKQGYAIEPVPNLLYNIAKSYEKLEMFPEAVDYYQEFVVAPEVDSNARKAALNRIESLREIAQLKRDQQAKERRIANVTGRDTELNQPEEAEAPLNTPAIWAMGGAVALLGGGLAVGYLASSKTDDINDAASFEARQDAQSSAKTYAYVADGLFVAAAAAAGVGLYLYFSKSDSDTPPSGSDASAGTQTAISPWVTPEAAGLGMSLDF